MARRRSWQLDVGSFGKYCWLICETDPVIIQVTPSLSCSYLIRTVYRPYSCNRVVGRYTLNTGRSVGPQLSARQRKNSAKSPVSAPP
jgi:hypothetical protein